MKILVADDAILFRRVMVEILSSFHGVEIVGQAANGKLALQGVQQLHPDVLTLDMEMPVMNGLAVLDALKEYAEAPSVIVVSALTPYGGQLTVQALQKGAFDFITKPDAHSVEESRAALHAELAPRMKALSLRLSVRDILRRVPTNDFVPPEVMKSGPNPLTGVGQRMTRISGITKPSFVLIGVSTGGPNALATLLPALPADLGVPVLIVQHMPPMFTQSLAKSLNGKCALHVCEASNGMIALPNRVYIAPGGRQMRIIADAHGQKIIEVNNDPPENNCCPAVDYLFRSAANHFPGQAMAVILTGMGNDGTLGSRLLKRHGCMVIAQDEASCVVYGMPKAAVDAGVADEVLPLESIAPRIIQSIQNGVA